MLGAIALVVSIYPTICLFSRRLHDAGLSGWLLAPAWLFIAMTSAYGAYRHFGATILASLTAWPGGAGVLDLGDMGGLYPFLAGTLCFAIISLAGGTVQTSAFGSRFASA